MSYKKYRSHFCQSEHKSYATFAKCICKKYNYNFYGGQGHYALIEYCRPRSMTLFDDPLKAEKCSQGECGSRCQGTHEIVELVL